KAIQAMLGQLKGILAVEMSAGQMVEDVRLAVEGKVKVEHYGRMGGMIPTPNDVLKALEEKIIKG
ncbi:MAG: 3-methyl-2-oxobutanoate dehydrogenase subunit beta, partial [Bacteroidales bacterium]|nr:3-methyl-2-oxobutanoate dehydrogenase subunit beta [Bacteroidales bacterium]